jgi:hypothetical protein
MMFAAAASCCEDQAPGEGLYRWVFEANTAARHFYESLGASATVLGIIAGLVAVFFPPAGVDLQLVTILLTALIGAAFGAWVSSMVASAIPNSRLKTFEAAIAAGRILMMVDVPSGRVDEIKKLIAAHHPEATSSGTEPTIPAFP